MKKSNMANPLMVSKNIQRSSYIWNFLSSSMNSFQTMLLLVVITHYGTDADAASFVMAYAAGNLLYNIGKFGVRQFQVTDSTGQYSFHDYAWVRIISICAMAVSVIIFIITGIFSRNYTSTKAIVVSLICLYKGIEAAEDLYHGRMQQKGRLDVAGKILFIRIFSFVLCYASIFIATKDILMTTTASTVLAGVLAIALNHSVWPAFRDTKVSAQKWKHLLKACFPLCLSMVLNMYLGNAPKYIIDGKVTDSLQTQFNIIYMPVFVLVLLGMFIYQPELKAFGDARKKKQFSLLRHKVNRLSLFTLGLTAIGMVAGFLFGVPILEFIYKTPLITMRIPLVLFISCGGMIALINLYGMVLITFRRQSSLTIVYIFSSLILFLLGPGVLFSKGIDGLAAFFTIVLVIHSLVLFLLVVYTLNQVERKYNRICINGYFTSEHINGVPRYAAEIVRRLDERLPPGIAELVVPCDAKHIPSLQNIHVTTWEERGKRKEKKGPLWGTLVYGPYVRRKKALDVNMTNRAEWVPGAITAIHDLISLRKIQFDLSLPEEYIRKIRVRWLINRWWFLFKIFVKRHTADTIVTISEASKKNLIENQDFDSERIQVVGDGWEHVGLQAETDEKKDPRITEGNYYFFIGNLYPHKNLKWIIDEAVFMPDGVFVIAGRMPFNIVEDLNINLPNVIFLGYISDAYMKWLMAHTKALLFPSRAEGFGIPPLEALALGRPAIVADIPVFREIYGNTVHYIDPDDGTVDLDELVKQKTEDPSTVLKKYTWENAAEAWLSIIQEHMEKGIL